MSPVFERLPGAFSGPLVAGLPKLSLIDPLLPAAGALYLFEPGGPLSDVPAGVPATGSKLTNLARAQAAAMIGGGVDAQDFTVAGGNTAWGNGGLSKIERTAKGGVHAILSKNSDPGLVAWRPDIPAAMKEYIRVSTAPESNHQFYFSAWYRLTRAARPNVGNNETWATQIGSVDAPQSGNLFALVGNRNLGGKKSRAWDQNTPGPYLVAGESSSWIGTKPTVNGKMLVIIGPVGTDDYNNYTADLRRSKPDRILYRVYGEDLTVSGRTYEQVLAADLELYNRRMVNAGGRYVGDTYTDPTTIA